LPADAWLSSAMSCSSPDTCAVGGAIVAPADVKAPPPPGTPAILFTTRNGGRTWEHFPLPGSDTMITQLSCPTSTVCYAIALRGSSFDGYGEADHANEFWATDLLRTNDSGRTWTAATFPSGPPGDYDSLSTLDCPTTSVCYAGAIRAHLVFGTHLGEREYTIGSVTGVIMESTDGGTNLRTATQTGSDTPDSISCPTLTVCHLTESDIAGTQLMATTNAGQSWTTTRPAAFSTPAFDYGIPDINCPTVNVCLASAPMGSNLLASTDRGRTWSPVPDAGYVFSASCTPRLSCVALHQNYHPYPGISPDANEIRPISLK
jgi:photosystem II stability/assembly factor-like uncharacterized protein